MLQASGKVNNENALLFQLSKVTLSHCWLVSLQLPGNKSSVVRKAGADLGSRESAVPH